MFMSSMKLNSIVSKNLQPVCNNSMTYVDSVVAKGIDDTLMTQPGFTIDQLMELAGLAVAQSAHMFHQEFIEFSNRNTNILFLCGPGNNGGDGLVASRHLKHFGYEPKICYPKRGKGQLFLNLVKQCEDLNIPFIETSEVFNSSNSFISNYSLIIDSLFGFSFEGPSREPFSSLISSMSKSSTPVLSVDVPSGWHVESGDIHLTGFLPEAVISLTLPKLCMKDYRGIHYVGGRQVLPFVLLFI